jgi:disulfide bond formation protein DsbB
MKKEIKDRSNQTPVTLRLALMLSAGIALATLTGCGQNSDATTSDSDSGSALDQARTTETAPAAEPTAAAPSAPSAANGQQLFATTCAGCHGAQGQGVPHLGKDLQTSTFVAGLDDAKLAAFIAEGRSATDPLNTTHVAMPPKGGNPALSSENIADIVAYIRQLQHQQPVAAK